MRIWLTRSGFRTFSGRGLSLEVTIRINLPAILLALCLCRNYVQSPRFLCERLCQGFDLKPQSPWTWLSNSLYLSSLLQVYHNLRPKNNYSDYFGPKSKHQERFIQACKTLRKPCRTFQQSNAHQHAIQNTSKL